MGSVVRLLFVALVAAGCALVPSPADVGPLVTVEAHGGLCPEGECRSVVAIGADGHVHRLEPDEAEIRRLSAETIDAIRAAMLVTDFDAIRSRPFTGECPTAFDGQELIFTFSTPRGPERIASCEVELDADHPLFSAVEAALGQT